MCSVLQVISNALGVWGLEIVLFNSREYQDLPFVLHEKAFICLRIMRVEQQQRPKLIGEDEAQRLQQVSDPGHTADEVLLDEDEEELRKALALSRQGMEVEDEEADLRRAIQLSMQVSTMSSLVCCMLCNLSELFYFCYNYGHLTYSSFPYIELFVVARNNIKTDCVQIDFPISLYFLE
uniref:Uncharacterized protein n=1 Tax=Cyprinus carpio TaxID=7962 RepID=A0A8C1PE59_CYPCA